MEMLGFKIFDKKNERRKGQIYFTIKSAEGIHWKQSKLLQASRKYQSG